MAPQDVISILIPILEARELFIPSRGEKIKAAPGFQLFGTQTLFSQSSRTGDIGGNLWTKVRVEPFSLPEMEHVIEVLYPALTSSIPTLMRVFAVASAPSPSGAGHQRHLSMRDLLKWCDRIHHWFNDRSPKLKADTIDRIFLEAIDCFCAMIPKKPQRNAIIQQIGEALSLSPEKVCEEPPLQQKNKKKQNKKKTAQPFQFSFLFQDLIHHREISASVDLGAKRSHPGPRRLSSGGRRSREALKVPETVNLCKHLALTAPDGTDLGLGPEKRGGLAGR